ncbi:Uncharacterized protein DAT39_011376, partial [Clarias magur]
MRDQVRLLLSLVLITQRSACLCSPTAEEEVKSIARPERPEFHQTCLISTRAVR